MWQLDFKVNSLRKFRNSSLKIRHLIGMIQNAEEDDFETIVRTHPIWPPRALVLGQLTHQHLARLRIDYVAS